MIAGENPFMVKERLNLLDTTTKGKYIELYKQRRFYELAKIAKQYNISTSYLYEMIRLWTYTDVVFSIKSFDFEGYGKDLSFPERLKLALELVKFEVKE